MDNWKILFRASLLAVYLQGVKCQGLGECSFAATLTLAILLTIVTTALFVTLCHQHGKKLKLFGTCFNDSQSNDDNNDSIREETPYFTTGHQRQDGNINEVMSEHQHEVPQGGNVNLYSDVQGDLAACSRNNLIKDMIYSDREITRTNGTGSTQRNMDFSQAYAFPQQHNMPGFHYSSSENTRYRNNQDRLSKPSQSPGKPPRNNVVSRSPATLHHGHVEKLPQDITDLKNNADSKSVEVIHELPPRRSHYIEQRQQHEEDEYTMAGEYPGGLDALYSQVGK